MAFKRTNFSTLVKRSNTSFKVAYSFAKKLGRKLDIGDDAYIIPLGLETGFYETPCHAVKTHKAPNGETIGFKGSAYASYIKCKGTDSEGHKVESLCCTLSKREKDRIPDKEQSAQRIIGATSYRIHLPILILGNSLGDPNKKSYPISRVSILNELRSEAGLKFAYLEMSSGTFSKDIVVAYGNKLKEDGILDYELSEESEEFFNEVIKRLPKTVIKVHGVSKVGFSMPMKEYSFFPFDNPTVASASPAGEREAILGYKENQEIQNKICEFLDLFETEVDGMLTDWTDKELLEYYNSALGLDIHTPLNVLLSKNVTSSVEAAPAPTEAPVVEEKVEVIKQAAPAPTEAPIPTEAPTNANPPVTDGELDNLLSDIENPPEPEVESSLEEFEFDSDGEDDFFEE